MVNCNRLAMQLTDRFGLHVEAEGKNISDGYLVTILPVGVERTISFVLEVIIGWRSIVAKFEPANFASSLVFAMEGATDDQYAAFLIFTKSIIKNGGDININISDHSVDPLEINSWPEKWKSIDISLRKGAIVIDQGDEELACDVIYPWVFRFFGAIMALLPLKEVPSSHASLGEEEGAEFESKSKQYERSKINRAACIEIHGLNCQVCNLNFENVYGKLGEGFIHIHHVTPVSMMNGSYTINPEKDLIPVCPNCHSMLHRASPPIPIEKLKFIRKNNK